MAWPLLQATIRSCAPSAAGVTTADSAGSGSAGGSASGPAGSDPTVVVMVPRPEELSAPVHAALGEDDGLSRAAAREVLEGQVRHACRAGYMIILWKRPV